MNYMVFKIIWAVLYLFGVGTLYYYAFAPAVSAYGFWTFIFTCIVIGTCNIITAYKWATTTKPQATYRKSHHA